MSRVRIQYPVNRGAERYAIAMKLVGVAERMKAYGIRVDAARANAFLADAESRIERFTGLFLELTGLPADALGKAGAGQTDATKAWFDKVGAPRTVFKKGSNPPEPQFNATQLIAWAIDYPGAPFAEPAAALLGLRKARTAAGNLRAYLAVSARHGGRIHFGFNPVGTKGERWSSSASWQWLAEDGSTESYSLNAQNIASKGLTFNFKRYGDLPLMVSLKPVFIPDPGCVFLDADYVALEAQLIRCVANVAKLWEWDKRGADIHTENAKALFLELRIPADLKKAKDVEECAPGSPEYLHALARVAAKPCMYGLTYSVTQRNRPPFVEQLAKQLRGIFPQTTEPYVKKLAERFFELHPEILQLHYRIQDEVAERGYVTLPQTGRPLYVANTPRGYNQACNFFFQSGGGAMINAALPVIAEGVDWQPNGSALLAMVHDSVLCQARETEVPAIKKLIEDALQQPADFGGTKVSVPAKAAVSTAWGEKSK